MSGQDITFNDKNYTLDDRGFLYPPEQWDDNFAEGMAQLLGIYGGMTEEHWDFINYLRKKFLEEEKIPVVVMACSDNKMRLSHFRHLFPSGYHRGACKIAGINYKYMYKSNYWLTYETSTLLRADYKMTALGFLEDFNKWNIRFAEIIIREWKLTSGLTDRHEKIINYLRDYYKASNNIPTIFETLRANKITHRKFMELFPDGFRRGACRMAGLPFFP